MRGAFSAGTKVEGSQHRLVREHPKAANVICVTQEIGIDISNNTRTQLISKECTGSDIVINMIVKILSTYCKTVDRTCFTSNIEEPFEKGYETTKRIFEDSQIHVDNLKHTLSLKNT